MISIINKTVLIIISICVTSALAINDTAFTVEKISIEKIKSSQGDKKRIKQALASKTIDVSGKPVYVIKIKTNLPVYTNSGCRIYFGDMEIKEFGSFENGVFIKVYSEEKLKELEGKELSYSLGSDKKRYSLGINAPNTDQIKNKKSNYESLNDIKKSLADE